MKGLGTWSVVALAAWAGVVVGPALAMDAASAAQLDVSAAPLQTWKVTHGLPELPDAVEEVEPETEVQPESDEVGTEPSAGRPDASESEPGTPEEHESDGQEDPADDAALEPPAGDDEPDQAAPPAGDQVVEAVEGVLDVTTP